jgi:NIPSNAP
MYAMSSTDEVVELRRYTLRPGERETLIDLFENELVIAQEDAGMRLIGQFRDLDQPDHFVWMRGFADMPARDRALRAFYEGPVWERHKDAANATMIDSDDVLLLRPAWSGPALARNERQVHPNQEEGLFLLTVYPLRPDVEATDFQRLVSTAVVPRAIAAGADIRGAFRTEHSVNSYTRLPIREGENVFVTVFALSEEALPGSKDWGDRTNSAIRECLLNEPQTARLLPTERSQLQA